MVQVLSEDAILACDHGGIVKLDAHQHWLTTGGRAVLVEADTLHRPIAGCPAMSPTTPPCTETIVVDAAPTYAAFVTAQGSNDSSPRRLCLQTATGRTNWSKLSVVSFHVNQPGQKLLEVKT
jgi:hypothetical protein